MDEKELKKAEEKLKTDEEAFAKKMENREKEFVEKVKEKHAEFNAYVEKTERRLEEESKGGVPFRRPKSCYSDSKTAKARKLAEAAKSK